MRGAIAHDLDNATLTRRAGAMRFRLSRILVFMLLIPCLAALTAAAIPAAPAPATATSTRPSHALREARSLSLPRVFVGLEFGFWNLGFPPITACSPLNCVDYPGVSQRTDEHERDAARKAP